MSGEPLRTQAESGNRRAQSSPVEIEDAKEPRQFVPLLDGQKTI